MAHFDGRAVRAIQFKRHSMGYIAALLVAFSLFQPASAAAECGVTEQALLGAWSRSGDAGFFDEFVLEASAGKRTFSSWLHERPELTGAAWTLQACQLTIVPRNNEFPPFRFTVLSLERDRLRLYDETDHEGSVYVRLPREP